MNNRIKAVLEEYNLSASKFADIVGVQASGISHILSGRNKPGYDFIRKMLIAFPEVSSDWLILGNGSMKREIVTEINTLSVDSQFHKPMSIEAETTLFSGQSTIHPAEETIIDRSEPELTVSMCEITTRQQDDIKSSGADKHAEDDIKSSCTDKHAEKVIIFYSDKSFSIYSPE